MHLKQLFVHPLERYIPPVTKVNDIAEETIKTELQEYIVTAPIERALADFLEGYAASRTESTDKIGVWISGFFGSGKSHFAKVLSYLLRNPTIGSCPARETFAARLAGSPRRMELEGLLHRVGQLDSQVIMFNIKTEEDQQAHDGHGESISEIMYRLYLTQRGLSADPAVASLELSLIERGLYAAFQDEVARRADRPWTAERDDFLFIRPVVAEALQAVAPHYYHDRAEALAALELVERSQRLAVTDLVRQLGDYVTELAQAGDPERPPRLVFIIDEIGQFIGTNGQKLLELQSIAEEFGTQGRGRLWLVVTAQAKLEALIGGVGQLGDAFGKIGDRFDIRLALTAEDVEKVLEGRILQKKAERVADIHDFYQRHEGALAVLAALPGASRALPMMTAERFTAATPFLPYHPALIQAIFARIQSATATGFALNPEARTMIGMAQGVLREPANGFIGGELGRVVTLDMVYDQIAVDLRYQDKQEIENLPAQLPGYRELDQRILKALYLLQAVPWLAVTANTLAHALLQDVRTDKVTLLSGEIGDSLKRLQAARYVIAKGDGVWEFLTGAKKSFEEEVAGVTVRQIDQRRAIRAALREVLRKVGKLNYQEGRRSFNVVVRGDGEELESGQDIILEVYSPLYAEYEDGFDLMNLAQVESFSHPDTVYWVAADSPDWANQLTRTIRLDAVLAKWRSKPAKTDEEREIIREKETELTTLRNKISTALRVSLTNGTIIWNGHEEELDGRTTTLNPIFNRHVSRVVPHVYPKFHLAAVKPNESEIKAVLTVAPYALPTVGAGLDLFGADKHLNQHSAVVEEVRRELERRSERGADLSGKALEEHFTRRDYGWHQVNVRLVLAAMFRAGMVAVKHENMTYTDPSVPAAQAFFTQVRPFRRAVFYYEAAEAVTPDELRRAQDELKVIFDVYPQEETANALAEQIKKALKEWYDRAERVMLELRPLGYPLPAALHHNRDLHNRVTNFHHPGKIVKAFLEHLAEVRTWHAETRTLHDFTREKKMPIFRRARKLLTEIERVAQITAAESLMAEDAHAWANAMQTLITAGRVAPEWDKFALAYTQLSARFRQVYQQLHARRGEIYDREVGALQADDIAAAALARYGCAGWDWDDGEKLCCRQCGASLETLDYHIKLIPADAQTIRERVMAERAERDKDYTVDKAVKRIRVAEVVPQKPIANENDLQAALDALSGVVKAALGEIGVSVILE